MTLKKKASKNMMGKWENAGNRKIALLYPCKILDWTKLKAFADDKIKVFKMMIFVFDKVENNAEKEKCWLPAFFLFQQCFQTTFYPGLIKVGIMWWRVKDP